MLTVADLYRRPKNQLVLMTTTTTYKQLIRDERPVVIGFYSAQMDTINNTQPRPKAESLKFKAELRDLSAMFGDKVKVVRVNVAANRELCDALGIANDHTVLLYSKEEETYRVAPTNTADYKQVQRLLKLALRHG